MQKLTLGLGLLLSFSSFAAKPIKSRVCPALTAEASTIISSIQNLQGKVKSSAECQGITEKLSVVSGIMTGKKWKDVADVISSNGEMSLEGNDLKAISELSEKASIALADIVSQLGNGDKCVDPKNKASFASKLSGVVKEVATIVGSVTGPYGMAVNLGGSILSSAITGIDKFYKSKHPYNFKNTDEELLFMNQFCSYAEIQKDMNDYLTLENRPEELLGLSKYLETKQNDMQENCPECDGYVIAWTAKEKANLIVNRITEDAQIVAKDLDLNAGQFTRCNEINRAIYSENSDLKQFFSLLAGYTNPHASRSDMSLIKDVVEGEALLPKIYPKLTDCWTLSQTEKKRVSLDFNNFIRDDILPLHTSIFGQQLTGFAFLANRKYKNPLGDYIEKTMERRKWLKEEKNRVNLRLEDPNYSSSVSVLIAHKKKIEDRLFDNLMVDYLKFLKKRNLKQVDSFTAAYKSFEVEGLEKYSKSLGKELKSIQELLTALDAQKVVDKRVFLASLRDIRSELDLAISQTETFDQYCHFMNYMLLTTDQTDAICRSGKEEMEERYFKAQDLDAINQAYIKKHLEWIVNDGAYQSSRVKDYSVHLQDWLNQGNARWELKP